MPVMLSDSPCGQPHISGEEEKSNHKPYPIKPKCNCQAKYDEDCICCEWSGLVYLECNVPNCPCATNTCSCGRLMCLTCDRQAQRATSDLIFSKKSFNYHQKNNDCRTLRDALRKRFPDDDFVLDGCGIIIGRCDKETDEVIETLGPLVVSNGLIFYEENFKSSGSASFFFDNCCQDNNGTWYTGDPTLAITLTPIMFRNDRITIDPLAKDFIAAFKYEKPTRQEEEIFLAKKYRYLSKREIEMVIERDFAKRWCGYPVTPNPFYLSNAVKLEYFLEQLKVPEQQ